MIAKTNKKAFTLIEVILVVAIIGMLAWILFKTYITMSQIAFRVEQQKIVNQELLFVTETLQNLANRNEIDYTKYQENNISLVDSKWLANILYMTGEDWVISMFSSWNCVALNDELSGKNLEIWCNLMLQKDDKNIVLTKDLVYMTDSLFKIIPFANDESYRQDDELCESNYLACIWDPWFWFVANIYNRGHDDSRTNNVSIFVQQFFNI